MKKIGNCMPNKKIIASLCKEKAYYEKLNERKVSDNKLFVKTIKPSLSEKFIARERISLSKNGEIVKTKIEAAEIFNNFFGNIVKNLNIFQYSDFDPIIENFKNPTLKAIFKYKIQHSGDQDQM